MPIQTDTNFATLLMLSLNCSNATVPSNIGAKSAATIVRPPLRSPRQANRPTARSA